MMESARTFLFILFAFLTFLLYQEWQKEHAPAPLPKASIESSIESYTAEKQLVNVETEGAIQSEKTVSKITQPPASATLSTEDDLSSQLPDDTAPINSLVTHSTDVKPIFVTTNQLKVVISPLGGNIVSAELLNYRETLNDDSPPFNLLENRNGRVFLALSGLYGENAPDFEHNVATYRSEKTSYQLANDQQSIQVDLKWLSPQGVEYTKRLTFHQDQYVIDVQFMVKNNSNKRFANRMFTAIKRDIGPVEGPEQSGLGMQSALSPAYSTADEKYQKYEFDDLEETPLNIPTKNGWIALLQHYFVTAWVPLSDAENLIDTSYQKSNKFDLAQIRITQGWQWVEPGESETFAAKLYVGPKIQSVLKEVSDGLELTVDYGFLWWIGQPIFYLLVFFQSFVINWGFAIILVTVAIKTLLYPLARAQYRSFAKMRLLQPKMAEMKEQYGDDRQQMSLKMMELYKKEKVNPLGGCLPLLVQMPVFIALYWVLMESVELRHAPFILWIDDLAVMDPYYVMPLIYGASMFLMQKMQPVSPTMDPMQQKMMQMMPVFMTVFFVFFPAGLVLYWLFNNLISIAQQFYITKQFNKEVEQKKQKNHTG